MDKDFDMDSGIGELPAPIPPPGTVDPFNSTSVPSMSHSEFEPPPSGLPYLVPKANMSRESLHTISDPRDDPYAAIYSSAPPSPGGGAFPVNSDKMSVSGRSTKNLLPPSQLGESSINIFSTAIIPPPRVPSPLAFDRTDSNSPFGGSPNTTPSKSPVPRRNTDDSQNPFGRNADSPTRHLEQSKISISSRAESAFDDDPIADLGIPQSIHLQGSSHLDNYHQNEAEFDQQTQEMLRKQGSPSKPHSQSSSSFEPSNETIDSRSTGATSYQNTAATTPIENVRDAPTGPAEDQEDHAKRIQSVYREYYGNDSQYYDGSEEWEALPQRAAENFQYKSPEPMPLPRDSDAWHYSRQEHSQSEWHGDPQQSEWIPPPQQYNRSDWSPPPQPHYSAQDWQQSNYEQDYYRGTDRPPQQVYYEQPVPARVHHTQSPAARPSYHSRPSTSYSVSSLPSRSRTPTRNIPLEPLKSLPTRDKLDDLSSPISYAKPRRFMGASGAASPIPRSASPANVLSSSYLQLADLPVPHRLRRSGSFSSIDFAPMRKYAGSEVDAGDTASIRSFARTEQSLMAVSAGAGRINRLPQDVVPLGKSGALASLRPQNYNGNRYI
jgi:hypothetical protein